MPYWIMPPWRLPWLAFGLALRCLMMSLKWIGPVALSLTALLVSAAAHADRDIVYAAPYYAPPGSHRTSHFHLYRVNPDGTGKTQLTFGIAGDQAPKWSPDGTRIAFTRFCKNGQTLLCLIRAAGGAVQTLVPPEPAGEKADYRYRWSPDGRALAVTHWDRDRDVTTSLISLPTGQITRLFLGGFDFLWSPEGRYAYLERDAGDEVLDLRTGTQHRAEIKLDCPVWLGHQIVGFGMDEKSGTYFLRFLNTAGRTVKQGKLNFPTSHPEASRDSFSPGHDDLRPDSLSSLSRQSLIYALNDENSTALVNWVFFRLLLTTSTMRYLTEGQFLAWSPDGLRFCIARGRDTTPYEKRRIPYSSDKDYTPNARKYRLAWSAPLYVRATGGGPMRALTPRLSWLTGADWRRTPKPAPQRNR